MALSPKAHARFLYKRVKKALQPTLWMINADAMEILVKEVGALIIDENLRDEQYRTRNFYLTAKQELKNVNKNGL